MKKIIFLPFLFFLAIALCNNSFCSGRSSGGSGNASSAAPALSVGNKGTITCIMDGLQKTFKVQQSFFEISLDVDPNGANDGLEILDGDAKKEGFQFEFKKTGTTKIRTDATGDKNCIINYYNTHGITYTGKDVTVVVSSYNKNHLTGTFSGKLVNAYYDEVTNGGKELSSIYSDN